MAQDLIDTPAGKVDRATGEIIERPAQAELLTVDANAPHDLAIIDPYAGGLVNEPPRLDAIATISAGFRAEGKDGKVGFPQVSRDGRMHLHVDPHSQVAVDGIKAALERTGSKRLTIGFPFNNPAAFVQHRFVLYSATKLLIYGDEDELFEITEHEHIRYEQGTAGYARLVQQCKANYSIYFNLAEWTETGPRLIFPDGASFYRLRTTSRHSIRNLRSALLYARRFTGGPTAGIPFDLALEYRDAAGPDGARHNIPAFTFTCKPTTFELTSENFAPTISRALEQGRALMIAPPRAETIDDAEIEGPADDDESQDGEFREITDDEAATFAAGGLCDARFYEGQWFGAVRGTSLDSEQARAAFLLAHTGGRFGSLSVFLAQATPTDADGLMNAAVELIDRERGAKVAADEAAVEQRTRELGDRVRERTGKTSRGLITNGAQEPDDDLGRKATTAEWTKYVDLLRMASRLGIDEAPYQTDGKTTWGILRGLQQKLQKEVDRLTGATKLEPTESQVSANEPVTTIGDEMRELQAAQEVPGRKSNSGPVAPETAAAPDEGSPPYEPPDDAARIAFEPAPPATDDQLAAIRNLLAAVGTPDEVAAEITTTLSYDEAASVIVELNDRLTKSRATQGSFA